MHAEHYVRVMLMLRICGSDVVAGGRGRNALEAWDVITAEERSYAHGLGCGDAVLLFSVTLNV